MLLFLIHSDHHIDEHSHHGGVGQGEDCGKHRGFVVEIGDVHGGKDRDNI